MKKIILLLTLIFYINTNSQKIILKKINDTLAINMVIKSDFEKDVTSWNIVLHNKKQKSEKILETYQDEGTYKTIIREKEPKKYIILGDALLKDRTLYLVLSKFRKISLNSYNLNTNSEKLQKEEILLGFRSRGILEILPFFSTKIIPIENKLIIDKFPLTIYDELTNKVSNKQTNDLEKLREWIDSEIDDKNIKGIIYCFYTEEAKRKYHQE